MVPKVLKGFHEDRVSAVLSPLCGQVWSSAEGKQSARRFSQDKLRLGTLPSPEHGGQDTDECLCHDGSFFNSGNSGTEEHWFLRHW